MARLWYLKISDPVSMKLDFREVSDYLGFFSRGSSPEVLLRGIEVLATVLLVAFRARLPLQVQAQTVVFKK